MAYAGNNINQYNSPRRSARSTYVLNFYFTFYQFLTYFISRLKRPELDLSYVYLSYDDIMGLSDPVRPKSAKIKTRSATSSRLTSKGLRAPSAQRYEILLGLIILFCNKNMIALQGKIIQRIIF